MQLAEIDREIEMARTQGPLREIAIPPCPGPLQKLRAELASGDPDPAVIARIAAADVAMAASLIRLANSPFFARSRPAATVSDAVAMLGLAQTVALLTGFLTKQALPVQSPLLEHFWETSARRAMAMGFLARQIYGIDPDLAQTCGLFSHVGIPVMLQGLKGYSSTLTHALARKDLGFIQTENQAHRTDHAVVGAIVAKTWNLPPQVAQVVRLHHDFAVLQTETIAADVRMQIAMLLLAEHLVGIYEGATEHVEWAEYGARCLQHLHVQESELDVWADSLHPLFDSAAVH
jgi:HD-like signal output (HDOD) protein